MKLIFWAINIIMIISAIIFSVGIINASVILLIGNFLLIIIGLFINISNIRINKKYFVLLIIFIFTIIISSVVNKDINLLVSGIYLIIFLFTFGVTTPNIINKFYLKDIVNITIISIIIIISSHMIFYGFTTSGYSAWYSNSNSLAIVATTLYTCSYSMLITKVQKFINRKYDFQGISIYLLFTIYGLYVSLITSSRASLMTIILITLFGVLLIIIKLLKEKKLTSILIKLPIYIFILFFILFAISSVFDFVMLFEENIIGKFIKKSNDNRTLFDGREYIWITTINEAGIFGKGDSYFEDRFILGALNTFIGILGRFGYLSAFTFIFIVLFLLQNAFNIFTRYLDEKSVIPIFLILNFILLSITEVQFYGIAALLFFMSISDVIKNINNKVRKS